MGVIKKFVQQYGIDSGLRAKAQIPHYTWLKYSDAVWYATTVYTTIGYGTMSPKTDSGKINTIFYAIFAIPLMLLVLNDLGRKCCQLLDFLYNKIKSSDEKHRFPISFAIFITVLFILAWALLFCVKLGWYYVDAIYYVVLTFTTVGFGDIMPNDPLNYAWINPVLALFYIFEKLKEQQILSESNKSLNFLESQLIIDINNICSSCVENDSKCLAGFRKLIKQYSTETGLRQKAHTPSYTWQEYNNAVWYATTIYTTIGYGTMAPKTEAGKVITIFYGLFGIPLMILLLNDLGGKMSKVLDFLYNKIICNNGDPLRFPMCFAILIIVVYILVSALLLSFQQEWTYVDSVYFTFITFTTIGLGDIMPENPLNMIWINTEIYFGLVLVSMILNMVNDRLRDRYVRPNEPVDQNGAVVQE